MNKISLLFSLLLLSACTPPTSVKVTNSVKVERESSESVQRAYTVQRVLPYSEKLFTQGLELHGGRLLVGTGLVGQSGVHWFALDDVSAPVASAPLPNSAAFGEGVTLLNGNIYQFTWQSGELFRFNQKLELQETIEFSGEGWGLTNDGKRLISSDGSNLISYRNPQTFAVEEVISVTENGAPLGMLNELEYVDGYIWANVWQENRIVKINAQTGAVVGWIDLAPLVAEAQAKSGHRFDADDVPNGIAAVDKHTLLVTGKRWPVIFEILLQP